MHCVAFDAEKYFRYVCFPESFIKPRPETLLIPVFLPTNNGIFRDLFQKLSFFSSEIPKKEGSIKKIIF